MKIAFTICTNSFISLARVVGRSLKEHNPDYEFYIGLCDKPEQDLANWYNGYNVIPCDEIGIEDLNGMAIHYHVSDIKNALKPFYLEYFARKFPQAEHILFIDPDMAIYEKLDDIATLHQEGDILLFPHLLHPQPFDGKTPDEISYLATGTYNLGLISVVVNENTLRFITWWRDRLRDYCYIDWKKGLFYDQKWIILAPVFFDKVLVVKHPGYNIGYWNLHERTVSRVNNKVMVNGNYGLVIYHYSNVNIRGNKLFTDQQDRYTETDFPLLTELFQDYRRMLNEEGYETTRTKGCYYANMHVNHYRQMQRSTMKGRIKLWVKDNFPKSLKAKLKKIAGGLMND
jgi:hypothetical protein